MASTFPVVLDAWGTVTDSVDFIESAHFNDLRDAVEKLEAKVGIDSSADFTSLDHKVNNFFATGRKIWIYENAAPTGWSINSVADRVVGVKGGSTYTTGGAQAGSWTLSGINTEATHTHNRGAHSHTCSSYTSSQSSFSGGSGSGIRVHWYTSHNHSITGGSGNTGAGSAHTHTHDATDRPGAMVGIVIDKT